MSAGVCDTESVYFFFLLSYVRGRVHERFFCLDELTHSLRAWILFSGVEFCGGEFTRCIFLNEPLLTVAISPVGQPHAPARR